MRRPSGRTWLVAAALAVLAASGTAAVTLPSRATAPVAPSPPTSSPPPPVVRAALLPPVEDSAPRPVRVGLQRAVGAALADPRLGGRLAVSVVDVGSGDVLYERAADTALLPASTAKIATAVAALTTLPADQRLVTRVLAGPRRGDVVLVGGGDPTLAGPDSLQTYPTPARLVDLAHRVRAALGATTVARVLVDDTLYSGDPLGPGWKPTYVTEGSVAPVRALMVDEGRVRPGRSTRVKDPVTAAGQALAALLQPGASVPVERGTAPVGAVELGQVTSSPVPLLVEQMLTRSDNDLAEALARQVALATGRPASFAGAATALDAVLGDLLVEVGVPGNAVALVDGSGLSRLDRLQPAALTRLLERAADGEHPALAPLLTGLPVAGFDGTLGKRYRRGPSRAAAGSVRAKTGTLDGVSALAGLVRTADGRVLAFDLTADAVPDGGTGGAQAALDALAAAFAACGCSS